MDELIQKIENLKSEYPQYDFKINVLCVQLRKSSSISEFKQKLTDFINSGKIVISAGIAYSSFIASIKLDDQLIQTLRGFV